jgi:hypothetical protein
MTRLIIALSLLSATLGAAAPATGLHHCCKTKTPCCSEKCCKAADNCCKREAKNPCAHNCAEDPEAKS